VPRAAGWLRCVTPAVLLPGTGRGKVECGEPGGFGRGDAQQPQAGLGELVDGDLVDALGVAQVHSQQPEQSAGYRAERDLGVGNGEPARGLPRLDVPKSARCQAHRDVQGVEACSGKEPGDIGVGPAEPLRHPGR
jgi:hypothetical protein